MILQGSFIRSIYKIKAFKNTIPVYNHTFYSVPTEVQWVHKTKINLEYPLFFPFQK